MTAQELAHVDKAGEGEAEVDIFHPQSEFETFPGGGHLERSQGKLHGDVKAKVLKCTQLIFFNNISTHSRSCDEDESDSVVEVADEDDGSGEEEDVSDEEGNGEAVERDVGNLGSREGINWEALTLEQQQRQPRRIRGSLGILKKPQPGLSRVFQSISLDSFTLLSTGTTSKPQKISRSIKVTSEVLLWWQLTAR